MRSIYVGSGLSNAEQVIELWQRLQVEFKDLQFTYQWYLKGSVPLEQWEEVSQLEYNGVLAADIFILLCPGKKGSHTELGIALATCPNVIVCGTEQEMEPQGVNTKEPGSVYPSIFYYLPSVTRVIHDGTIEDLFNQVKEVLYEKVYSKDKLHGGPSAPGGQPRDADRKESQRLRSV